MLRISGMTAREWHHHPRASTVPREIPVVPTQVPSPAKFPSFPRKYRHPRQSPSSPTKPVIPAQAGISAGLPGSKANTPYSPGKQNEIPGNAMHFRDDVPARG
jgi:hypothetical protein